MRQRVTVETLRQFMRGFAAAARTPGKVYFLSLFHPPHLPVIGMRGSTAILLLSMALVALATGCSAPKPSSAIQPSSAVAASTNLGTKTWGIACLSVAITGAKRT